MVGEQDTRFSVVRYGNVVGTRGSVVPFFEKLIKDKTDHLPITHPEMTRFWITLQEGVNFVLKNFERMLGGEIFIPKIPSMRVVDLATSMAPELEQREVGIRPGEKIHEIMCPQDDSHLTLEFDDHFVIIPSIHYSTAGNRFTPNKIGEEGEPVKQGYEYNSGTNPEFLTVEALKSYR